MTERKTYGKRVGFRHIAAMLLITVCALANVAQACDVLMCSCTSARHRSHVHTSACCHACHGCGHDVPNLASRCDCSHNHDAGQSEAVTSDTDRLLKQIRIFAADAACTGAEQLCAVVPERSYGVLCCELKIPPATPPDIAAHAPRAPSVKA